MNKHNLEVNFDHMTVPFEDLKSQNKRIKTKAILYWQKDLDHLIKDVLLTRLFTGDDALDSGIIQVLVKKDSWGISLMLNKAFQIFNTPWSVLSCHNILSMGKYMANRPEIALPILLGLLDINKDSPGSLALLTCFISNISKLSKPKLQLIDPIMIIYIAKNWPCRQETYHPEWVDENRIGSYFLTLSHCPDQFEFENEAKATIQIKCRNILKRLGSDCFINGSFDERIINWITIEKNILSKNISPIWLDQFNQLANNYLSIMTSNEFDKWLDSYSMWLFELMLNEIDPVDTWLDYLILQSNPQSESCLSLGRQLIRNYTDIIDHNLNQFNDGSIGSKVFCKLLSSGDSETFSMFKKFIQEDKIRPTRNLLFSFRSLIMKISGSSNYFDKVSNLLLEIGNEWEMLCQEIAEAIYGSIIIHPILPNGKIPDIIPSEEPRVSNKIIHTPLIIECKKSLAGSGFYQCSLVDEIFNKYGAYCNELQIWVLTYLPELEFKTDNNIHIMYAEQLAEIMDSLYYHKISSKIRALEHKSRYIELDKILILNEVGKHSLSNTLINEILEMNHFLEKFYDEYQLKIYTKPHPS